MYTSRANQVKAPSASIELRVAFFLSLVGLLVVWCRLFVADNWHTQYVMRFSIRACAVLYAMVF